jgi:hypothetical protein
MDTSLLVRGGIGLILLVAGAIKLFRPGGVRQMLVWLRVPRRLLRVAASGVALGEIALGGWLWSGVEDRLALAAALVVFTGFAVVLTTALRRGYRGSCGCLGSARVLGVTELLRTGLLGACCVVGLVGTAWAPSVGTPVWEANVFSIGIVLISLVILGALGALIQHMEDFHRVTAEA